MSERKSRAKPPPATSPISTSTIRIPAHLHQQLRIIAEFEDKTLSDMITVLLEKYVRGWDQAFGSDLARQKNKSK